MYNMYMYKCTYMVVCTYNDIVTYSQWALQLCI